MDLAPPPTDAVPTPAPDEPAAGPPDRVLGGVAALLGDRLGVDALWIRIGFVLLALVGGIGVLLYGSLWLALVYGARPDRRWARIAGGGILVFGLPFLLRQSDLGFALGPVAVFALLAGLAVALWQPRRGAGRPSVPLPRAATGAIQPASVPAPRRAPRPPSILGRLTLGVALLVAALGALIDQANGSRLHPEQWLGAAAVVCGVGLVAGAFRGRARWLVVPALLFAGIGYVAGESAGLGLHPTELAGSRYVWISAGEPGGGERREHVVVGDVDVNIDGAPASPMTVDARTAIGDVHVRAADDVSVEVRARADDGDVRVDGVTRPDGTLAIGPEGKPDVVVIARTGRGDIDVSSYEAVPPEPDPPASASGVGRLTYVAEGVELTTDGSFALSSGEAVIGPHDDVLVGDVTPGDRVQVITTSAGEFRLLPEGLLLTPYGELLDLHAVRDAVGTPAGDVTEPPIPATPPATPPVPTTAGG